MRSSFQREDLLQDMDALETVGIEAVLVRPGEEIPRDADYLVYLTELEDGGVLERMDVQRAEELLSAGLDVPQITRVAMSLRDRGLPIDPAVYTVEDLERQLLALKGGGAPC